VVDHVVVYGNGGGLYLFSFGIDIVIQVEEEAFLLFTCPWNKGRVGLSSLTDQLLEIKFRREFFFDKRTNIYYCLIFRIDCQISCKSQLAAYFFVYRGWVSEYGRHIFFDALSFPVPEFWRNR